MPDGNAYFAECQDMLVLKLVGVMRAGPQSALCRFTEGYLKKKNYRSLLVDMSQTSYIDSTYLGTLAAIAKEFKGKGGRNCSCILANETAMEAIELISLDVLFTVVPTDPIDSNNLSEMVPEALGDSAALRTVLDAHRTLSEIAPKNELMFRNVIEVCESQLGEHG